MSPVTIKRACVFKYSARYVCAILVSRQISTKAPRIKFQGKPFSGSCVDTCRQTDGHDEGNGCFFGTMQTRLKCLFIFIIFKAILSLFIVYEILFISQHYETLEVTSDRFYVDRICTK